MQFGFMLGCSTTDATFIIRQLKETFHAVNSTLYMAFVDLEKAFDCVPRRVILWALRKLGIKEWQAGLIRSMYENSRSRVCVVAIWVKSSVWKWECIKALAWAPYCSSRSWNSSPKSFVQRIIEKVTIFVDILISIFNFVMSSPLHQLLSGFKWSVLHIHRHSPNSFSYVHVVNINANKGTIRGIGSRDVSTWPQNRNKYVSTATITGEF